MVYSVQTMNLIEAHISVYGAEYTVWYTSYTTYMVYGIFALLILK